ncbi:methionyl-tRNA formyltransferase [Chondrinema litorale]|uniref:methionyl-tRNA formyltransferase n=1 Tax=Chondrinema litorale TaxID=2994555 RepID=UPI0025448044|nr:methionyl-tRNA formyltransferase [Chondrinema litorale]UZR92974.1 methionyl-tRNA formyltransferase [Chondrinema litorale]
MKRNLNIVFMGTPEFAVPSLEKLIETNYNIVGVVTAPDKPAGRGLKMQYSPVKESALKHNIPVLQPEKLKDEVFLQQLKDLNTNLIIVVAFRMLPEMIWSFPEYGTFNLHGSLLPQYRGAAPINWAVINGEKESGLTTFFLKKKIDTGDLILQEKEPISEDDTAGTLYERLMNKGAGLVLKTVQQIETESFTLTPQDNSQELKPAPKIFRDNCKIDFSKTTVEIYNFVRGLSPYPAAWTDKLGKTCKVFTSAIPVSIPENNGEEILTDQKTFLYLKTADSYISIVELQPAGKKKMPVDAFLRGYKL